MMESTLAALDLVVTRGFVDEKRVGIGGLSRDRRIHSICLPKATESRAASVAGGYMVRGSTTPRRRVVSRDPKNVSGSSWRRVEVWASIDVAQQTNKITAPILFNFLIRKSLTAQRYCDILKTSTSPLMRTSFLANTTRSGNQRTEPQSIAKFGLVPFWLKARRSRPRQSRAIQTLARTAQICTKKIRCAHGANRA